MRIVLGSKVVHNGYLKEHLKGATGKVVAVDNDSWYLVQFDDWLGGHGGYLMDVTAKIKKGFTEGGNSCWWCPKTALENVKARGQSDEN